MRGDELFSAMRGEELFSAMRGEELFSAMRGEELFSQCFVNVDMILNFKTEMCIPLKAIPKEDSSSLMFLLTGQLAEDGGPDLLIHER